MSDLPAPDPEIEEGAEPHPEVQSKPQLRRVPNIGNALLFGGLAGLLLIGGEGVLAAVGKSPGATRNGAVVLAHPRLQIGVLICTYAATLAIAAAIFRRLWHRPFGEGLQWNWAGARRHAGQLIALGLFLGFAMALATSLITQPKALPIDDFFVNARTAWLITLFGVVVAPVFEEISFRGFLLPALAIAYDWLSLPRTEEALERWQANTTLTPMSLIFCGVFSSVCFAMMHAQQVLHLWAALGVLFSVSLALTYVRVRVKSVAASALVHSAYNGFVFVTVLFQTGGYRHLERMTH